MYCPVSNVSNKQLSPHLTQRAATKKFKIDECKFVKKKRKRKKIKPMQGTSFQRENRGIEAIIWIIKAQKCKPFCSTIYVLQAKIHLEFSLCVTGLPCFMN